MTSLAHDLPRDAGNKNTSNHWLRPLADLCLWLKSGSLEHISWERGGASLQIVNHKHTHTARAHTRPTEAGSVLAAGMGVGPGARHRVPRRFARSQLQRPGSARRAAEDSRPRKLVSPGLAPSEPRCRHSFAVSGASFSRELSFAEVRAAPRRVFSRRALEGSEPLETQAAGTLGGRCGSSRTQPSSARPAGQDQRESPAALPATEPDPAAELHTTSSSSALLPPPLAPPAAVGRPGGCARASAAAGSREAAAPRRMLLAAPDSSPSCRPRGLRCGLAGPEGRPW